MNRSGEVIWPVLYKRSEKIITFVPSGLAIHFSISCDARMPLTMFSLSFWLFLNFLPANHNYNSLTCRTNTFIVCKYPEHEGDIKI